MNNIENLRFFNFRVWDGRKYSLEPRLDVALLNYYKSFSFAGFGRVIEQYTGLKDKNGKPIYEGDILQNIESDKKIVEEGFWEADDFERSIVYYDSELARFGLKFYSKYGGEGYTGREQHIDMYVSEGCEIIGNIHENPELLK